MVQTLEREILRAGLKINEPKTESMSVTYEEDTEQ
jgi:hypothetical protein